VSDNEKAVCKSLDDLYTKGGGYAGIMVTCPQTLGYSLVDSPVELAADAAGRDDHCPGSLELRPVGGKQQSLWPSPIIVAGPPKNGVQFMVKDSKKYASTGGSGFAQFNDGKPVNEAVHNTCFACHQPVQARDFVFTNYAP
jgi:hypothetical protein